MADISVDKSLQHALRESYRGLLLHGRYPIAFLNLEMPADQIDVNVHPAKLEVRFQEGGKLYSQLLGTLRNQFLATDLNARQDQASPSPGAPAFQKFPNSGAMGAQNPERNPGSVGDSNFQLQQENANRPQIQPDSQTAFEFPIARPDAWEATRGKPANSPGEDSIDNRSPSFGEAPTRFDFTRGSIGNSGRDRSADVQFESNSGPDHSISGPFPHESEPEFSKDPAPRRAFGVSEFSRFRHRPQCNARLQSVRRDSNPQSISDRRK